MDQPHRRWGQTNFFGGGETQIGRNPQDEMSVDAESCLVVLNRHKLKIALGSLHADLESGGNRH